MCDRFTNNIMSKKKRGREFDLVKPGLPGTITNGSFTFGNPTCLEKMAQVRQPKNYAEALADPLVATSENWNVLASSYDLLYEAEEEVEEEDFFKEPSYEIYEPPPPEERDIGRIIKDSFGFLKKEDISEAELGRHRVTEEVVYRYTLCNANGIMVQVITLGAAITAVRMPDNRGVITDVTLGLNDVDDYTSEKNELCFGSLLGRFNSLISYGELKLGKKDYALSSNVKGIHHEKGGHVGFDKVLWESYVAYDRVIMTYVSPHLDEGYPGHLMIQISFHLTNDNCLIVNTTANTSLPTILSIGHNLYFNMAGHETGPDGLREHSILINADKFVQCDKDNIPTGDLENVGATYFDLRVPRPLWKAIDRLPRGGYDHVFCLTKGYPRESVSFACRLIHPPSGRYLEIMTDMPGLYVNTGTNLPNTEALPPLEAQAGFSEELYPEFCREEKMKEKEVKELQAKMAAKQTWPRQESLPKSSELKLPSGVEAPATEKKVLFKEKHDDHQDMDKLEKGESELKTSDPSLEQEDKSYEEIKESMRHIEDFDHKPEDEVQHDPELGASIRFLKDVAESDEEENDAPKWSPPQPIIGRKGAAYKMNGGVCFMCQEYPDPMKFKHFPKPVLKPGDKYSRTTIYKFGIIPQRTDPESALYL